MIEDRERESECVCHVFFYDHNNMIEDRERECVCHVFLMIIKDLVEDRERVCVCVMCFL